VGGDEGAEAGGEIEGRTKAVGARVGSCSGERGIGGRTVDDGASVEGTVDVELERVNDMAGPPVRLAKGSSSRRKSGGGEVRGRDGEEDTMPKVLLPLILPMLKVILRFLWCTSPIVGTGVDGVMVELEDDVEGPALDAERILDESMGLNGFGLLGGEMAFEVGTTDVLCRNEGTKIACSEPRFFAAIELLFSSAMLVDFETRLADALPIGVSLGRWR